MCSGLIFMRNVLMDLFGCGAEGGECVRYERHNESKRHSERIDVILAAIYEGDAAEEGDDYTDASDGTGNPHGFRFSTGNNPIVDSKDYQAKRIQRVKDYGSKVVEYAPWFNVGDGDEEVRQHA